MRVVFDASAKTKSSNRSLNDCIHKGCTLIPEIPLILLQFRLQKVAIIADIKKAFHQIRLHPKDRDITRFLWVKNPDEPLDSENLICYRFTRIPFGMITSPFILTATLQYHFLQNNPAFYEKFSQLIYVDNLVTSVPDTAAAMELFHMANQLFGAVSLQLAQWASNNPEIRALFPLELAVQKAPAKILRVLWDFEKDTLRLRDRNFVPDLYTKWTILKSMSLLYDPMGWFQPLMVPLKSLIKKLWEFDKGWDSPIPQNLLSLAQAMIEELKNCPWYEFPR